MRNHRNALFFEYSNIAHTAFEKYLFNKLPIEGKIDAPMGIVMNYFSDEDFQYYYQEEDCTYYKLKERN